MKIAAVSMVKDECDVIELFVRINARCIDQFFIIDNGSTDATKKILDLLVEEGFRISLSSNRSINFAQDVFITEIVRQVADMDEFDWIFPLDADEFIQADRKALENALEAVPQQWCGRFNWATFVPVADYWALGDSPLWNGFRQRKLELRQFCKVIVPSRLARQGRVTMGNHDFKDKRKKSFGSVLLDIPLAHVPIRSSEQLVSKILVGSHKLSFKKTRRRGEGFHWDLLANRARDLGFRFDLDELQLAANAYCLLPGDSVSFDLLSESHVGLEEDKMRYGGLARINLLQRCDAFMGDLCAEIRHHQDFGMLTLLRRKIRRRRL